MRIRIAILLCCVLTLGCDSIFLGDESPIDVSANLELPPSTGDGIEVSSPSREGLDSAMLFNMVKDYMDNGSPGIRSILISRNNKLVLEAYFDGWNRERRQDLRSASKSFVSAVAGIAIDKGVIASVDEKVLSYFPEYQQIENHDARKYDMTIRDLLRMRTGLGCNDWSPASPGNQEYMYPKDDWIKFIFDLPVVNTPGSIFSYCSGAPIVVSAIITKASGKKSSDFADENLFAPLGITDYVWEYMPGKREYAGGKLHMRPRDFLKFGLLMLNDGRWNDQVILSEGWIQESIAPNGTVPVRRAGVEYGYYWWVTSWDIDGEIINAYYANGNGGQLLYIFEELDMVVAFTGNAYNTNADNKVYSIIQRKILPAVLN